MKKLGYILLLIVLCFGMCIGFSACGKDEGPTTYTITFREEGQEDIVKVIEEGKDLPIEEIPVVKGSKEGYVIAWDVTDFTNITEDIVVNAVATPISYKLTINANGGSVGAINMFIDFDSQYQVPTPTRKGYTFIGWKIQGKDESFPASGTWTTAKDVTIQAKWQANDNVVFFKDTTLENFDESWALYSDLNAVNGGVQLNIKSNEEFVDPTNYIKSESNWFVCFTNDQGKVVEIGDKNGEDIFVLENETVNLEFKEVEVEAGKVFVAFLQEGCEPVIKTITSGESLDNAEIPAITQVPGYEISWSETDFTAVTENIRVKAIKTQRVFKIYYDIPQEKFTTETVNKYKLKKDGSNGLYFQEVTYLSSFELVESIKDLNYKLVGWKIDGTGVDFVSADRYELTDNVTLMAVLVDKTDEEKTNDDNWSDRV